ncbi:uncharacterized protein [Bemisia tabaci]|uniref:uncharacterized protein isoform X2 n=2 Tax=Bemisia tabaci TaxID=7038 RepID=UPI003B27BC1C
MSRRSQRIIQRDTAITKCRNIPGFDESTPIQNNTICIETSAQSYDAEPKKEKKIESSETYALVNVANDISNNDSDITHPVNEAENSFIENLETHQSNSKPKKKIKSKSRDLSVNVANDISNNDSDITHPVNEAENSFIENLETHQSNSKLKKKIKSKSRDLS